MQLSDYGVPVVLEHTPFDEWSSTNWTFEFLADQVSSVVSKKSKSNVFRYYAVDKPLSNITDFKQKKTYREKTYTGEQFFQLLTNSSKKRQYYYASGGVELLQFKRIYTDESLQKLTFGNFEPGQVNFWFGGENVTAYTHYDTSYNLHSIIRGRKKFILFPPSAYKALKLYPSLHEFYRQVQANVLNLTRQEYRELLFQTSILEVVLNRGQVLYIPPYWFHCVVTLEPTVSLNVWSQSDTFLAMEDVYAQPIPFEEVWGRVKLMRVMQHFVTLIIQDALPHYQNISDFIKVAVVSRYEPIFGRMTEKNRQQLHSSVGVFCLQSHVDQLLDTPSLRHVTKRARKVGELFKSMLPTATREINVANYLEHMVWRVMGTDNVAFVPFYFNRCF